MTHWGVGARLLSCASMLVLGGTLAGSAWAHGESSSCTSITHPTTINHDKKCVTVKKTIYGDVVNNAKVGKSQYGDEKPGFFIGDGGLLKGKLVNNGGIYGGERGEGALTLGDDADVRGGIFNNGKIYSEDGSGISLGFYEDGWHGGPQEAALTGDIVNRGYIGGDDYGIAARYGTMSGTLINESGGVIEGDKVGVYIADSFGSWTGGIENSGLIYGDKSGIQIGGPADQYGGEGGEHGGGYNAFSVPYNDGVVFAGGISNTISGAIISKSGPSIAVGGASFSGGITNDGLITQYPGYGGEGHDYGYASFGGEGHDSPYKGVGIVFTADTVEGGLFNGVHGVIYGTKGPAVWITDKTESFSGGIANFGLIKGANDGIRIESDSFSGGLVNAGAIIATWGDGVSATSAWSGDVSNYGLILGAHDGFAYDGSTFDGDVTNAGLILGGHAGVAMSGDVFDGAFTNAGFIGGGKTGVALDFDSVTGGFTNSGKIVGYFGDGVSITAGTWGAVDARADIVNSGIIIGGETGFSLNAGTVYGDFINNGAITGYGENTGVHIVADAFFGDIVNNESIASPYDALVADIEYFDGNFANTGDITGGANGAVLIVGEMTGDFTNSGSISGAWGNGVDITVDTWGSVIEPVAIANTADGVITGGATGFALDAGTVHGSFTNDGLIDGGTTGVSIAADTFDAPFANSGAIAGGVDGVVMTVGQATGGFSNSGSITGESGNGVDIVVGSWGTADAPAHIVNEAGGTISGGVNGLSLDLFTMHGDVTNDGSIDGGNIAVLVSGGTFDGAFTNSGDIDGGATGVALNLMSVSGAFTNSGSINGGSGDGVAITVDMWGAADARADLVNTATGTITGGETGFALNAGTVYGDFINDGQITGNGENTGVHIVADAFYGDIANNETIDSPYDALVADIDLLDGAFANAGTIAGGANGAVLIVGEMTGGFTNSGSISGEAANGVDVSVDTWGSAIAPVAIANTTDGVITGGVTGFALDAGVVHGSFANDGSIEGGTTGASIAADTFDAPFANSGDINGGSNGVVMVVGDATGGFSNSGSIEGSSGNGVDIVVTNWGTTEGRADIVNTTDGAITGGANGFALALVTMHGDVTNDGRVEGGDIAMLVSGGAFDGAFTNTGTVDGGATGVALNLDTVSGAFTNSGTINGETGDGVAIDVGIWGAADARADIVNAATGVITGGETGFALNAGTVYGDFINNGQITGDGENTGVHITANEFFGDVVNNEAIDGAVDALVADINTLDGGFTNTGSVEGGANGAVLIVGDMSGGFTNSGSISGATGDGVSMSVDTLGAADARADIVNTATGVITGGETGFALNAGTVYGDFINNGQITGDGENTGVHITADAFFGDITNNEVIDGAGDALVADIDTFDGSFANTDTITGGANGAVLIVGEMSGDFTNSGSISGETANGVDIAVNSWGSLEALVDIRNTVDGEISGGVTGFALDAGTVHGAFTNDGLIEGGTTGASFAADTFDAPFANSGEINGGSHGVVMVLGDATGGFTNSGSVDGETGNGIDIVVTNWGTTGAPADILNTADGTIGGGADGFSLELVTMHGDIDNDGAIGGGNVAVLVSGGTFDGAFTNTGDIDGGATGVALDLATVTGAFTNSGSIDGVSGDGVAITVGTWGAAAARADIVNTATGVITGGETGFLIDAGTVYGDFINDGQITGGGEETGVHIIADTFAGNVVNNQAIDATHDALVVEGGLLDGDVVNTGTIAGGDSGAVFDLAQMNGDFTNGNSIVGETVDGVSITVDTWGSTIARVDIANTADGVISGGATGFALDAGAVHGAFVNDGLIEGGTTGASFAADTFDAPFANSGDITGGSNGVVMALGQASGGFSNSGSIDGATGNGVDILVTNWGTSEARADVVNAATGVITGGETGFLLDAGTVYGDFVNNGQISGGGQNTGLHIIAGSFVGDVVNNDMLDAPSNALHLEIGELDGEVVNTGTITATAPNGVAAAFAIGNGATFTNTGGGLITGDVVFGGDAAYHFVAEDGRIDGDLIGEGGEANDDTITVQNGSHIFTGGTASNFASFVVEGGATAFMGAQFEGDPAGSGYAFSNVDNLTVNNGGTLYVDRATTLVVDNNFTQQAGGTLEFYLGAPGGSGFEDLTGNVVAGDGDYGQIVVNGTVTLDGAVVGFLDPAFADANPGLDQVLYEDVIVANGGVSGNFTTVALIADSSLFELDDIIDGNSVDMTVTRTSLNIGDLPGIVVNTGGPFDAMVSDRSNGLGSGSCGLAGDGWCFNKFAANEPGATQVMTDASPQDPFQWLRTGVRKEGETAVWGRVIGAFGETDGYAGSLGTEFRVGGAIAGIDHVFSPTMMAGLAAQWTTTDVDFNGRPDNAQVDSFEAGAYMSYGDTRLYLNANASVIWHDIEVSRFTPSGNAFGSYDGLTYSAFAEVGKTFETQDMRIQPFLALSYSHLETNDYSETGTGTKLNISGSEFDSLKSMVGARVGFPIELDSGRKMVPEFRLAWAHEFMDDQASFVATIQGQPPVPSVVRGEKFSRDTVVVGGGITVPLSDSTSVFVDYDGGLNSDITTHTVSAGIRVTW